MTPNPEPWMQQAACTTSDPELFFTDQMGRHTEGWRHPAAAVCATCPVTVECLAYALRIEGDVSIWGRHGVYGGLTPNQRIRLVREKAIVAASQEHPARWRSA
ncbi:MAG TPA: WhiB family transcriptional regulator [Propionibacteriaceae bacterium]|jgi:WhiB family redox-sensing transcriptional regulator